MIRDEERKLHRIHKGCGAEGCAPIENDLSTSNRSPRMPAWHARELQGDADAAAEAWSAAEKVAPDTVGLSFTLIQLAELEWSSGNVETARASYDRAARLDPTFRRPQGRAARTDCADGRIEEAIAGYRAVVDRLPPGSLRDDLSLGVGDGVWERRRPVRRTPARVDVRSRPRSLHGRLRRAEEAQCVRSSVVRSRGRTP